MVKSINFLKRKPGMSVEAFQQYWRTTHAELVKKVPELRKYVQCHTLLSGYRKGEPVYDGVAELWYDNTDTMRRIADLAESRVALADDENFLDMSKMTFILTQEHGQKEGPTNSSMVKLVEFVSRRPGMEVEAFQEYWRTVHGPLAAKIPMIRHYVQCHTRLSAYRAGRQPLYDGVAEVWFDSTEAMRQSEKTPEYAVVRADEPNFIDGSKLRFIITKEYEML
jgi:uncharacterized protein (TIGR02118 family)